MAQSKTSKKSPKRETTTKRQGKLSLHPLQFEGALVAMLNTPPPAKSAPKAARKRTTKKATKK